ncbi:endonuclease III [Thiobacter aerophilum]|uniref:Endonuclease III n=1 Tax=Thiobacter aerophilum TaxID=3121275 RepID=A0ABV0EBL4_9BURK
MTAPANRAREILARLLKAHPNPRLALVYHNPLELLVAVILSAQCTDARVNEVTRTLFRKYRSARDYAEADPAELEADIRPTGFYRNKARLLIACCRKLVADFGGRVPDSLEAMLTLPGVGRKTANMVLGNAFGIPGIAVDTHVARVAQRLGLAASDDPEEIERALMQALPKQDWVTASNVLILHGRETCTARKPRCGECVLRDLCPWPGKTA